jgi:hypothetical protein
MPLLTGAVKEPLTAGTITSLAPAPPGWRVDAYVPREAATTAGAIPTPSSVVAWVLVQDDLAPGGATVQPVFCAGDRTWTPDQFWDAFGSAVTLKVVPA